MRIKTLLNHRATLLVPGYENGYDEYNRPITTDPTTRQIRCRLDQMRVRTSTDELGTDVILDYVLYLPPDEKIEMGMKIFNVIDEDGNVVADGTFAIQTIIPIYSRKKLHHYEVGVLRGDVNYTNPVTDPVVQTQVVTFAGKNTNDGDETRKIYFGLTEDDS
ncbi:putative minor capsid protein [Bacillaceae bacterium C204]|uniref:putative minor capsid protein n=1 Tax=Neobacillus sp. 204 TaxID=3383351 RepID=UPI003977F962